MIITYEYQGQVLDIEFDSLITSADISTLEVTSHPVESGSPVNDHMRKQPDRFTVTATVSDTPLSVPTTNTGGVTGGVSGLQLTYESISRQQFGVTTRTQKTQSVNALQFNGTMKRVKNVYDELKLIQDNQLAVSVKTMYRGGLLDYDNMAIAGLTAPRDGASGSSISFQFEMTQLRIVDTQQVEAPTAKQLRKKKGEKGKTEVKSDEKPQLQSIAEDAKEFLKKFL